jgi:hypothetical protein
MGSAPDAVVKTHCGGWKNGKKQGGRTSWKLISRATSMRFLMIGS